MGQYFYIVNLDKCEYLDPLNLRAGMKLWEICANSCLNVLGFLLRQSSETGGGDIRKEYTNAGRWANDRIVVVGDYDESDIFNIAGNDYKEISQEIKNEWNDFIELSELKIPKEDHYFCRKCQKETKDGYICKKCNEDDINDGN